MGQTKTKKLTNKIAKQYIFCYAFLAFAVVHFALFYIAVNVNSILLAFKQTRVVDGALTEVFTLNNFKNLFNDFKNPEAPLIISLFNTLKYFAMGLLLMLPLSLFISYFLYKKIPLFKGFRVVLFLPSIISGVVFVAMFNLMLEPFGLLYNILYKTFGYKMPSFLTSDATATPTIMFYVLWTGLAGNMILYQGAMNRLPDEVIEAGQLDGISWFRELVQVVLPMIWPTFSITVILAFTGIFMAGGPIMLFFGMSREAPYKTSTIAFYIFNQTWNGIYNYSSAIGIFFTFCSLPIVFGVRFIMSKIDPEVEY
jgi:ABC-type sugar transport system permease subunit